jgi:hypothetical protein
MIILTQLYYICVNKVDKLVNERRKKTIIICYFATLLSNETTMDQKKQLQHSS